MGDRLATIDMFQKVGAAVFLSVHGTRELGPHLTQCRLSRGLPPYQVISGSIQPFGDNRHGLRFIRMQCECGEAAMPLSVGEAGSLPNTMWPGLRPASLPSGILIHPTIHQRYKTDRQTDTETDNGPIAYSVNRCTNGRPKY